MQMSLAKSHSACVILLAESISSNKQNSIYLPESHLCRLVVSIHLYFLLKTSEADSHSCTQNTKIKICTFNQNGFFVCLNPIIRREILNVASDRKQPSEKSIDGSRDRMQSPINWSKIKTSNWYSSEECIRPKMLFRRWS